MASTPYERGYQAGQWTEEEIVQTGGDDMTPEEFLATQLAVDKQKLLDSLLTMTDPDARRNHAEYMDGYMAGERDSLSGR